MNQKDIIRMNGKELRVIEEIIERRITQRQAASIVNLSERQIRRIVKRVRTEGDSGIIHHSRNRLSNRKIQTKIKEEVVNLYREKYSDFGPTLANEKLFEINKIKISISTLRDWLIKECLWKKARKRREHRCWRERKACFGQMLQMDGSHHDWMEGRGPKLVIMAYIDDATNTVFARFYDYEGTIPTMDSFKGYIGQYGVPQCLYLDKHTTYKSNAKLTIEEELEGKIESKSQFEKAMEELGVDVIHANSPIRQKEE